jgi:imidazoleglycerol-phosphate dehydratase
VASQTRGIDVALGDRAGICRFGDALVPLDEALVRAAVDLAGRPYVVHCEPDGMAPMIGSYDTTLTRHFFETLGASAAICLHLRGRWSRAFRCCVSGGRGVFLAG